MTDTAITQPPPTGSAAAADTLPPLDYSAARTDSERDYLEKLDATWAEKISPASMQQPDYQTHRLRMLGLERSIQANQAARAAAKPAPTPAAPPKPTPSRLDEAIGNLRRLGGQADAVRQSYAAKLAEFAAAPMLVRPGATRDEQVLAADADHARHHGAWREASEQLLELDRRYYALARAADEAIPPRVTRPAADTTEGQLLAEVREQRFWARTRATLNTGDGARALATLDLIVGEALTMHDRDGLWAILAEAPSYLRARGLPADLVDGFVTRLQDKAAPLLPAVRQYRERQAELAALKDALRSEIGSSKRDVITFRRP